MSKYDLVLYDLDGTLWDSIPLIMECFKKAYDVVLGGTDRTDEDLMSYIGRPLGDTFSMCDDETKERLINAYLEYNCGRLKENAIPIFPGVYDFLSKIGDLGVKQGIVTSKRESSAMITIDLLELGGYFDTKVFREATERAKPYGDPLIFAAKTMGITDMSRVLYVGDAVPDILSARDAGADFALVGWTKMPREELESLGPDYIVEVPELLPCIIKGSEL
ncbi:MAG: HAD-IA family hydrolase [Clostridiales bacterium]|jgi:pyrophosphatase PpaX|nr:HAD-IA family hydrolase [Clostridiales bacterium]